MDYSKPELAKHRQAWNEAIRRNNEVKQRLFTVRNLEVTKIPYKEGQAPWPWVLRPEVSSTDHFCDHYADHDWLRLIGDKTNVGGLILQKCSSCLEPLVVQELFEHVEHRLRMGYVDNCADIILEVTMPRVLEDWARLDYKGGERKTNEMYLNICKQISKKYKSSDFPDCSIKLLESFYKSIEASAKDHFSPKIFHFLAAWTLTSTSTAHVVESLNVLTGLNFEVLLVDRDSFRPALSSLVIGCLQKDDSKLTDPIFRLLSKIVTALQPGCEFSLVHLDVELGKTITVHPKGAEVFGDTVIKLIHKYAPSTKDTHFTVAGVSFASDELKRNNDEKVAVYNEEQCH
ncbi:unnamed protein product [Caenorhabditis sp. 36 PRJEB53466]|nr:unnamed protein product [Caenorhabditis sp. 36 PRJEB53466]